VSTGDYVGIQVTAAAEIPVKYYKFRVSNGTSSAAGITGVTVAGKEPNSLGVPGDAHNAAVAGDIHLTSAQITAGREIVVTSTDIVSIRVGTSTYNFLEPSDYVSLTKTGNTYTGTIPGTGFVASPWAPAPSIVVEVTSENKIAVKFYKFVVTTADNAALTGLTVGGVDVTGLGTPAGAWNSSNLVNGTVTLTSAQATGAAVVPTATNGGTITYAVTTDAGTEPTFAGLPEGGFNLTNGSFLYIKLEYTTVDGNTYRNIYRISITAS
jgi:hypothetical protein